MSDKKVLVVEDMLAEQDFAKQAALNHGFEDIILAQTFSEALGAAIKKRKEYTGRVQGNYEQYQRSLEIIEKKLKLAQRKQENLERIQRNYQSILPIEESSGNRLGSFNDCLPDDLRKKLELIGAEMRRTHCFRNGDFVYSTGQRGLICFYLQECAEQIATRKMTQESYEFLIKKSPRAIIKQLLR